ncbi:MAG: nucleoid-associated protein [Clostridia bacterium]|nr:nucleoid-associated protein [Clostridia bacterium]
MRYIKDILLEKAIIHIVDPNSDEPIIAAKPLKITEEVEEFVRKHVIKSLNDDETISSRFLSDQVEVASSIFSWIQDDEVFYNQSVALTERMFKLMKTKDIPSGDMLFVQYVADEQRCFGLMKLDYQVSYMHNITFSEDDLVVELISQEIGLPSVGQRLKKCAFFTKAPENQLEMIVLDKKEKVEDGHQDFFVQDYLECVKISDDTLKTRNFKKTVEKWTQKNLADHIDIASEVRDSVNDKLLSEKTISVEAIAAEVFEQIPEMKESFKEAVAEAGYRDGTSFEVDQNWVEKKMKSKQIRTDTGVVIKGEFDFFNDSQRFTIRKNGDGTVDYVIKGVRNVVER